MISIVKRFKNEFVGRLEVSQKFGFVVLDNRNIFSMYWFIHKNLKTPFITIRF